MKVVGVADNGSPIGCLKAHPHEQAAASMCCNSGQSSLWTLGIGDNIRELPLDEDRSPNLIMKKGVGFHPDGSWLVIAGNHIKTKILEIEIAKNNLQSAAEPLARFKHFPCPSIDDEEYQDVAFTANGNYLFLRTAALGRTNVVEWNSKNLIGTFTSTGPFAAHPCGEVMAVALNDQGGSGVYFIHLRDTLKFSTLFLQLTCNVAGLAFSGSGQELAVLQCEQFSKGWFLDFQVFSFPGCERLWKTVAPWASENVPPWYSLLCSYESPIRDMVLNFLGTKVLCPWPTGEIVECDVMTNKEIGRWKSHDGPIMRLDVCYQTGLLVSGGNDGFIKFWQLDDSYRRIPSDCGKKAADGFLRSEKNSHRSWRSTQNYM